MASSSSTAATASSPVVPPELEADLRWEALADGCYDDGTAKERLEALLLAALASCRVARVRSGA